MSSILDFIAVIIAVLEPPQALNHLAVPQK